MKSVLAAALALFCAASARAAVVALPPSPAFVTISPAEMRDKYDVVWAVSDVHGHLEELETLLTRAALITRGGSGQVAWMPGKARQLLVVVGDCIDWGPDSVGVVLLFRTLQAQAEAAGSRVIVLLGNHEAEFLYKPRSASRALTSSAARAGVALSRKHQGEQLAEGEFGQFLRGEPVAAIVGSWLFAHAGYLDAADDDAALRDLFARIAASWPNGDKARYGPLRDSSSILEDHTWWKKSGRRSLVKAHLTRLGLEGLVFGHDPSAFKAPGTLALQHSGWFIKIDSGMKTGRSSGMLLRCEVASGFGAACRELTPDGALHELPVR